MAGSSRLPFTMQKGEQIVFFTRQHPALLAWRLFRNVLMAIVPVVVATAVMVTTTGYTGTLGTVVLLIELAWILFWAIRSYFTWFAYEHNLWVVTNYRIVDATRPNWFSSRLASANLVDVEDITVNKNGILPTLFDFGELRCQTAGERLAFVLAGIPKPASVLDVVNSTREAVKNPVRKKVRR